MSPSHSWARKQDGWRFQKTRQTWLLVHMFQEQEVGAGGSLSGARSQHRPTWGQA